MKLPKGVQDILLAYKNSDTTTNSSNLPAIKNVHFTSSDDHEVEDLNLYDKITGNKSSTTQVKVNNVGTIEDSYKSGSDLLRQILQTW